MPAYYLEIAVVVLGLLLLVAEAFLAPQRKRCIAHWALAQLPGMPVDVEVVWLPCRGF